MGKEVWFKTCLAQNLRQFQKEKIVAKFSKKLEQQSVSGRVWKQTSFENVGGVVME